MGWKAAAIYCYIEQEVSEWFNDNIDDIYDENHKEEEIEEEDQPGTIEVWNYTHIIIL